MRRLTAAAKARAARWRRAYDLVDYFAANVFQSRDSVACAVFRALEAERAAGRRRTAQAARRPGR